MPKSHAEHVVEKAIELAPHAKDPVALIIAALFHDIGNKSCLLRKVVESEIDAEKDPVKQVDLQQEEYAYRIEHMYWGAIKTMSILEEIGIPAELRLKIVKMVITHDAWKVTGYIPSGDEWLLREADASWMLSPDGIARDIARSKENGLEPMSESEQYEYNSNLLKGVFKYLKLGDNK
jgi:hypothetical protein